MSRGLLRVLDRVDAPAMVTNDIGEALAQNPLAVALLGDESRFARDDPNRSRFFRWFTDLEERALHQPEDHRYYSHSYASALRLASGRDPDEPRIRLLVDRLLRESDEFATLWAEHDVSWRPGVEPKVFLHPRVGRLELECQTLYADNESQFLLVYTATPGTESADRLRLLGVIGDQSFVSSPDPQTP